MQNNQLSHASESIQFSPFSTSHSALLECKFRWLEGSEYLSDQSDIKQIETTDIFHEACFVPEFKISINKELLAEETKRAVEELLLHIIVRDKSLYFNQTALTVEIKDAPDTFKFTDTLIDNLSGVCGLEFGLIVTPKGRYKPEIFKASNPGEIVASKFFTLSPIPDSSCGFPYTMMDPPFPPDISDEAMWYIAWKKDVDIDDHEKTTADVLSVVYNKACSDKLYLIGATDAVGELFWENHVVDIYMEIALIVLTREGIEKPPSGTKSFIGEISSTLEKVTGKNFTDLVAEFSGYTGIDSITKLRSQFQAYFKIKDTIKSSRFTR